MSEQTAGSKTQYCLLTQYNRIIEGSLLTTAAVAATTTTSNVTAYDVGLVFTSLLKKIDSFTFEHFSVTADISSV